MSAWDLSNREQALLNAALNPDADKAVAGWKDWASQVELERAPQTELRLLPAAYTHLSRVAPTLQLPQKLRGKARANFSKTQFLAYASLPIIAELCRHSPVMVTKGLAMCVRFDAWSWRPMLDIDIHIPTWALDNACKILAEDDWTPHHGMTWQSLLHRSSSRRDSWNFTKGRAEVDLHWRVGAGRAEDRLSQHMWETGEALKYSGQTLLLQSPEFAFAATLNHGFLQGDRADLLQTIVDTAWLLPICKGDQLATIVGEAGLATSLGRLAAIFDRIGLADRLSSVKLNDKIGTTGTPTTARHEMRREEPTVLRRPLLYRWWEALGRKARIERLLLRWGGPFSKPLQSASCRDEYDLRECAVVDEIGGPGWSWPEPGKTGIWADRADARLLIPLRHLADHLLVVSFSEQLVLSPNQRIDLFANGFHAAHIDLSQGLASAACCVMVTRRMLLGPWVELSFRPKPYLGHATDRPFTLTLPVRGVRVLSLSRMTEIFSGHNVPLLHVRLLKGEEPYASKLARIQQKITNSPHKSDSMLPPDFDPLIYVLSYPDLFEREVDPYQHFLAFGRSEDRMWR